MSFLGKLLERITVVVPAPEAEEGAGNVALRHLDDIAYQEEDGDEDGELDGTMNDLRDVLGAKSRPPSPIPSRALTPPPPTDFVSLSTEVSPAATPKMTGRDIPTDADHRSPTGASSTTAGGIPSPARPVSANPFQRTQDEQMALKVRGRRACFGSDVGV